MTVTKMRHEDPNRTPINPGRFTRAAIHCEAGELELKLSPQGNWQLQLRAEGDPDWRLACSGDLSAGANVPHAAPNPEPVRFGPLLIDAAARRACVGEAEIKLSTRQYELLLALSSQPERVFTKAELMRKIWECDYLRSSRTLESHASRVRNAIRKAGAEGFVINCHGVGYKLWEGTALDFSALAA